MSTSIIPYLDEAAVAALLQSSLATAVPDTASTENTPQSFADALNESLNALTSTDAAVNTSNQNSASAYTCPAELEPIFEEAANTFGVSKDLLKAIAKAESNFNPSAVSCAGAVGIMQLMPSTAAGLGVSNSYDARENIMGGAALISSLLTRYNGDTSLALAAYNAGSGNVEKYGGIPPFTETQNYVKKVLSNFEGYRSQSAIPNSVFELTGEARAAANEMLESFFSERNITKESLDLMVALLKLNQSNSSSEA